MEFTPLLIWWVIIQIFGLVGWPVAFRLLRNLPDRGFAFARPLGLLLSGYVLWLAGSFGLLRNNLGGVVVAMLVVLGLGLAWLWPRGRGAGDPPAPSLWLRAEWRYALAVEVLFAAALFGWAVYKAYNPDIETSGGEKWMEIAFVNASLRSPTFPPQDPWLSGFGISYYYFGYVLMSMVTRLAGLPSLSAFNLYVPTLFGLTLAGAFGIGANLVAARDGAAASSQLSRTPALLTGGLAALFVGVMGHLEGLLEVFHARGLFPAGFWTWLDIRDLKAPPTAPGGWIPDRFLWWWRGSRVLTDYTLTGGEQEVIDEFPFFSFLLADVHPHVLALPFVLIAVALALNLFLSAGPRLEGEAAAGGGFARWLALGRSALAGVIAASGGRIGFGVTALCLGALGFLNTWDFPIYLLVVGLALAAWQAQRAPGADWLGRALVGAAALGGLGGALYLPFYLGFQSQAGGILPNLWNPTRLPQFFVFFGPFLVAALGLLIVLSAGRAGWRRRLRWTLPLAVLGPVALLALIVLSLLISPRGQQFVQGVLNNPAVQEALGGATIGDLSREILRRRLFNPWTFLAVGGLLGWTLALWWPPAGDGREADEAGPAPRVDAFALVLLAVGLLLPLSVEFVYLRDNFGYRMNTVFKFYFQAWVLLALAAAYAVYRVGQARRRWPVLAFQGVMSLLILGSLVYPALAPLNKTDNFSREPTLDGSAWAAQQHPDDYAGIMWLREHAAGGAVVLEAPGPINSQYGAYNYTGRVSALTGLPTLLGWGNHEHQWRGNYEEAGRREPDIDVLYNSVDPQQALTLLDKYDISYVYVGPLERQRYNEAGLAKFARFMDVAFEQGQVTIYQRR